MAPKPMPWFRFYVETIDDPKILLLTPAERWVWPVVLSLARSSKTDQTGRLELVPNVPVTVEGIAAHGHIPLKLARSAVDKMLAYGLLRKVDGFFVSGAFGRRQFESDDSTPRSQRARSKPEDDPDATAMQRPINGDATFPDDRRQTTEVNSSYDNDTSVPPEIPSSSIREVAAKAAELLLQFAGNVTNDEGWKIGTARGLVRERSNEIARLLGTLTVEAAAVELVAKATGSTVAVGRSFYEPRSNEHEGCTVCDGVGKYEPVLGKGWLLCETPQFELASVRSLRTAQ